MSKYRINVRFDLDKPTEAKPHSIYRRWINPATLL